MLLFNIGLLAFILMIILFFAYMVLLDKKSFQEKDVKPLFEAKVSAIINTYRFSGPIVRFSIYENFIVLRTYRTYIIYFTSLYGCPTSAYGPNCIILQHNQSGVPLNPVIYVNEPQRVKDLLSKLGNFKMINENIIIE